MQSIVSRLSDEIGPLPVDRVSTGSSSNDLSDVESYVQQKDPNFAAGHVYTTNVSEFVFF